MAWLVALIIVDFLWNRLDDERGLRETRRLLRRMGGADSQPSPESPSPHQLLGDVARPRQGIRLGQCVRGFGDE